MGQVMSHATRVMSVVSEYTSGKVVPESTFDQLDMDQLDLLEVAMELEDIFGIEIPAGAEEDWGTVQGAIDAVVALLKE